jgi:hypothetical protein
MQKAAGEKQKLGKQKAEIGGANAEKLKAVRGESRNLRGKS